MTAFRISAKAIEDLKSIGRYTQQNWGPEQRNKYLSKLDKCFHTLAIEPELGRSCDYIRKGYRKYHIGRHLIFYRQKKRFIEIIRILHERMDTDKHIYRNK